MFTWILIAIIIAAIFGLINLDNIKNKTITIWNKYLPEVKKYTNQTKEKIENAKKNKENKE